MEPAQARAPTLQGHLVAWEGVGERGGGWDSEICLTHKQTASHVGTI